jgi:hypothetical protein
MSDEMRELVDNFERAVRNESDSTGLKTPSELINERLEAKSKLMTAISALQSKSEYQPLSGINYGKITS